MTGPTLAELFAALPVAVMMIDADDRVGRANARAETLLNLSERVMRGRPLSTILPSLPDREEADGGGVALFDIEVALADGHVVRVDRHDASIAEHPGWRAVTLHEVAASRRLGDASERAGARAAVGAAAMLAHEIRNPLSGIRGAAQLLAAGERADGGSDELTRLITTEVDRVAALIDRMQDFSDTRALPLEAANIYPLLAHARNVASAGFARGIVIEERFDPSLPPALVNCDALLQVLLNLFKNAAEALGDGDAQGQGRRIIVTTAFRHGMAVSAGPGRPRRPLPIEICIVDTGPGAPEDIAASLFDPFVSGRPEGKGLGLALVDKLVRDMGGVVFYAREGQPPMTVFRVLLPRASAPLATGAG